MNVIVFNFGISSYSDGTSVASSLSKHFGFNNTICLEKTENLERIENTWKGGKLTLIDYFLEVKFHKYRDMDVADMPALSRELIEKLSFHRCQLFSMHRDETLLFRDLDKVIMNCFTYWNYLIDFFDIDLVLFNGVPHAIYTYSLYGLCKVRGIKTIFVARSCVPGYSFCYDDIFNKFDRMEREYFAALEEDQVELSDFMREFYLKRMEDGTFKTPATYKMSFVLERKRKLTFGGVISKLIKGVYRLSRFNEHVRDLKEHYRKRAVPKKTEKHYRKYSCPADYAAKFIYFPLHMQPELTTSPHGNVYVNLPLMVKTIADSIKDTDILVYCKEHADQRKGYRLSRRELYDDIRKIPNVRLINIEESTFKLQEHAVATATCSGTVIMETLFRYKPILVFGNHINNLAPNAYIIKDIGSCRAAIDDILGGGFNITQKHRDAYLKAVEKSGFRGYVRTEYANDYLLTQDENTDNIFEELKIIIGEWLNERI